MVNEVKELKLLCQVFVLAQTGKISYALTNSYLYEAQEDGWRLLIVLTV